MTDRETVRRAVVYAWRDCIPRFHIDLDRLIEALDDPTVVSNDVKAGGLYPLDSYECWPEAVSDD